MLCSEFTVSRNISDIQLKITFNFRSVDNATSGNSLNNVIPQINVQDNSCYTKRRSPSDLRNNLCYMVQNQIDLQNNTCYIRPDSIDLNGDNSCYKTQDQQDITSDEM